LITDPSDNLREILQNVVKPHGVSNMRKLGHLNNFIKLLCNVGHCEEKLGFTYEEIIICLRLALLNEAKEVRAAGLRALRYLIQDATILQKVLGLRVDYLIARCIDIQQSNEVERTQALRLVRKMITVNASLFPSSITNSLIAVGNDGLQERDRMVRACIAIICELALQNPEVVALRGGLSTILKNVIDCQLGRINEALMTTILHLLNHPKTRQYVRSDVELEQILAPYTDFHYRHNPDTAEGQLKPDLMDNYLALVLSAFISSGLLEGLVEVITSSDDHVSVRATILLGELLHMWPNVNLRNNKDEHMHNLLNFCSLKNQDHLLKLTVSTLDYSRDGLSRVILSKILTAAADNCRLYATKHLRVLLRANVEFFSNWGMELLVTQLHDKNKTISMESLDILDEACEDKANLHALIQMKPALSHLGDKGVLLLLRFLSIPKGFSYLNERGYVTKQLEKWQKSVVPDLSYTVRSPMLDKWEGVKTLKAALWALLLGGCMVSLQCEKKRSADGTRFGGQRVFVFALPSQRRGVRTCLYVIGLISKTKQGCDILKQHSWDAVRHSRRHPWPVVPDDMEQLCSELLSIPSTLSLNSESASSRHNSENESTQPSMYILDDDKCDSMDLAEDQPIYMRPKPLKDRSPFTILASTRFVRNRFLNSLTLPSKKLRSSSDPKGGKVPVEPKPGLRRNRTVTEPSSSTQGDFFFTPVFNGSCSPNSPTVSLKTSLVGSKASEDRGSTPSIGEPDLKLPKFMKALSFASLDKEDLLSPINQNTLQRSSSVRSMVSNATYGCSDDYIGLALPMDINEMFQVKETPYFQQRTSPPAEERLANFFFGDSDASADSMRNPVLVLRQQISITELMNSRSDPTHLLDNTEDTGLQEHTDENCLYCVGVQVLGCQTNNQINCLYCVGVQVLGCQTNNQINSTLIRTGGKSIPEDAPASRVLLRKEVLRLVVNLSSSVGTKGHETGLLTIKEKFPYAFDDICLYSEVSHLLAHCMFRLLSRRFIQELFQDVQFTPMYEEAETILATPPKQVAVDAPI
ncbi:UNVERIFIED_CONTAM: hypothetical protein FKN15_046520, partial [Acipenser sinensis]